MSSDLEPIAEAAAAVLTATDVVTTGKASSVVLVLQNGAFVSLRENSRLKITTALQSPPADGAPAATRRSRFLQLSLPPFGGRDVFCGRFR